MTTLTVNTKSYAPPKEGLSLKVTRLTTGFLDGFWSCLPWILMIGVFLPWSSCSCSSRGGLDGKTKIFRFVRPLKSKSLDPHRQFDYDSSQVVTLIFDSLYSTHYLKRPVEFVPNLAQDMPVFSDDGKVMTISLRRDVKFQDGDCFPTGRGRNLVASDVIYSFTRFADPSVNPLSYGLIEGLIEGLDAARNHMKTLGDGKFSYDQIRVSGLTAVDDYTIRIKLTRATMVPMQVMAKSVMSIVPRECIDRYGEDFQFHPLGTGAFKLTYMNRFGDIRLAKNADYHLTYPSEGEQRDGELGLLHDAGKKLPFVDEIFSPVIGESQPAVLKFERGYFDWIALDADSFKRIGVRLPDGTFGLRERYQDKVSLYAAESSSSFWLTFNMRNKILGSNKKLRQALGMVINRRKFIDQILDGRGVVLDSLVPSTLASNHVSLGFKWYEHDLSAAKILMKEAGFPEGKGLPEFRYLTATHGTAQKQYEFFRRVFAEVGVRLKFDSVPVTSYYKRLEAGDFEVTLQGWYADFPDPENFTGLLTTYARSQGQNYGAWSYGAYDKLSDSSKLVAPGKERDQLFLGMAEIIREEVPVIPLFSPLRAGIYPKDWVRNFKRDVEGHRDPIHIDIDVAKQKEGFRL